MNTTSRNILIITGISAVGIFIALHDGKLFGLNKNKEDKGTSKPCVLNEKSQEDKKNADQSITALRMATNDGASVEELTDLKKSVFNDYGLKMSMDGESNVIIKNVSGKTILKEPLING